DQIQSRGSGVGICGMHERAFQFGGSMDIESDGRGTKISVTLPAATDAPQAAAASPWEKKELQSGE
ncbi:MAG: hypothetical protein ACRD10_02170, partial [Terriglobia bacterium]